MNTQKISLNPTKTLPESYRLLRTIDLSQETRLLLGLNLVGFILFILFGWLFFALAGIFHPNMALEYSSGGGIGGLFLDILKILATFVGAMVLHELIHGLFFWLFTGERPRFGLRTAYAYAYAPGWYLPRNQYLLVGASPLIVLSLIGVALLPFLSVGSIPAWWFMLTVNASGAVGDLYVVGWLLRRPLETMINDQGDKMGVFIPE